jgi:hypothetical protein
MELAQQAVGVGLSLALLWLYYAVIFRSFALMFTAYLAVCWIARLLFNPISLKDWWHRERNGYGGMEGLPLIVLQFIKEANLWALGMWIPHVVYRRRARRAARQARTQSPKEAS